MDGLGYRVVPGKFTVDMYCLFVSQLKVEFPDLSVFKE
jgi:hypothetical protein